MRTKTKIVIREVCSVRNGSAGVGYHVVRFERGRGEGRERFVAVVFPDRHCLAVHDVDRLARDETLSTNTWDGPFFEDDLRQAVLAYERGRAAGSIGEEEVRDLTFGQHICAPCTPKGICVFCHGAPSRRASARAASRSPRADKAADTEAGDRDGGDGPDEEYGSEEA